MKFLYTVLIKILVFNIAFKNTTTVPFLFLFPWLKKGKGMGANEHGPHRLCFALDIKHNQLANVRV